MAKPVKVYNKGKRPIVFKRDRTGVDAIHPGKFLTFDPDRAEGVIEKFEDACSEKDYEKHLKEMAEREEGVEKKTTGEKKKKTKTAE